MKNTFFSSKWSRIFIVALLILALSTVAFGKTKLRVTTWEGAEGTAIDESIIAEFVKLNPEYEVVYEAVTDDRYYQKVLTDIGAGTPPDVILLDAEMIPKFFEGNFLTDLAPFLSRLAREGFSGSNVYEYFPVLVDIARIDKKIYSIPKDTSPMGIFYNKKMFDEMGVPYPPEDGWTMEQFTETAKQLTKDLDGDGQNDTWGFAFPSWVGIVVPLLWAGGGEVFSPDFSHTSGYLNSEINVKTYQTYLDLLKAGYAPTPQQASALGGSSALFYTGKVGMVLTGRWFNISIKGQIKKGLDLQVGGATLPFADINRKDTVSYLSGWSVPSGAPDKRGAVMLAAFLSSDLAQRKRCLEGGLAISANRAVAQLQGETDPLDAAFIKMLDYSRVPVGSQTKFYRPKFEDLWAEAFDKINVGGESLKSVLDWMASEMDKAIAKGES
ncbi:MAG: sugar ABC transporter substrate-binding protein [Thermotogota bacterium]|nr:sugar ABC transporter substrate-binding protein [Thermotogota bacterium]